MRISKTNTSNYTRLVNTLDRTYEDSYFSSRGVTQEVFDLFKLGTASATPREGLPGAVLGSPSFPIFDINGQVVSIAFRTGTANTKYWSFPYEKKTTLYALYQALPSIMQTQTVYITEGYFDVLVAFSLGITNTVGVMGVSISKEQCILLASIAKKFILVPDSDKVGVRSLSKNRKLISSMFPDIIIEERYVYPSKDFADHLLLKVKNVGE